MTSLSSLSSFEYRPPYSRLNVRAFIRLLMLMLMLMLSDKTEVKDLASAAPERRRPQNWPAKPGIDALLK
jgi:hypothetical protein